MAPKAAASKQKPKADVPPQQQEDELLARLAAKELETAAAREQAQRLAATRDELGAENFKLTTEVDRQRSTLRDINEHLTSELKAAKQRVAALEAQLADAQQKLAAAASKAQADVDRAKQRYSADLLQRSAELAAAQERLKGCDAFAAEKGQLQERLRALGEEIDELKKAHHKRVMDLERKHAQDRELWKKDTAAAVKAAREEMMALTDNRLEITTKRTILENEQMSGELQYQSRQVQNLVQRNEALQRDLSELRAALDIAKRGEEELVRKNWLCERTIETLLARLEDQDAERDGEGAVAAEYQARISGLEEELHELVLQLDQRAQQAAALAAELEGARCKLAQAQGSGCALAAEFLQRCLEEARQQPTEVAGGSGGAEAHPGVPGLAPGQREGLLLELLQRLRLVGDGQP